MLAGIGDKDGADSPTIVFQSLFDPIGDLANICLVELVLCNDNVQFVQVGRLAQPFKSVQRYISINEACALRWRPVEIVCHSRELQGCVIAVCRLNGQWIAYHKDRHCSQTQGAFFQQDLTLGRGPGRTARSGQYFVDTNIIEIGESGDLEVDPLVRPHFEANRGEVQAIRFLDPRHAPYNRQIILIKPVRKNESGTGRIDGGKLANEGGAQNTLRIDEQAYREYADRQRQYDH